MGNKTANVYYDSQVFIWSHQISSVQETEQTDDTCVMGTNTHHWGVKESEQLFQLIKMKAEFLWL